MENSRRYSVIALVRSWGRHVLNNIYVQASSHEDALIKRVNMLGPDSRAEALESQFVVVSDDGCAKLLKLEEPPPTPPLRAIPVYGDES